MPTLEELKKARDDVYSVCAIIETALDEAYDLYKKLGVIYEKALKEKEAQDAKTDTLYRINPGY